MPREAGLTSRPIGRGSARLALVLACATAACGGGEGRVGAEGAVPDSGGVGGAEALAEAPASLLPGPVEFRGPPGSVFPHLHATADGRAVMSWLEEEAGGHALRVADRGPGGWSEPRTAASGDRFFVNWADFPSVTELADGAWLVHWLQKVDGGTYAYHARLALSRDRGATWSEPFAAHDDASPTEHGFVSVVPRAGGGAALLWLDGREMDPEEGGEMTLRFRVLGPGGRPGPEELLDARSCECCQTALAGTPSGLVAAWRDRSTEEIRDIAVARRTDGGWSGPRPVGEDGWEIAGCPVNGPQLAARGERVALAWFTAAGGEPRVRLAFSEDGGVTFADPVPVDRGLPLGRVDVALLPDGSAAVAWLEAGEEAADLHLRRVGPDGAREAPVLLAELPGSRPTGFPRLALAGEALLVGFTDPAPDGGVRVRRVVIEGPALAGAP